MAAAIAKDKDLFFFYMDSYCPNCPEYNGFNIKMCQEAGIFPFPKTDVSFMPLIDQSPAHPDTIMTSMENRLPLVTPPFHRR